MGLVLGLELDPEEGEVVLAGGVPGAVGGVDDQGGDGAEGAAPPPPGRGR